MLPCCATTVALSKSPASGKAEILQHQSNRSVHSVRQIRPDRFLHHCHRHSQMAIIAESENNWPLVAEWAVELF